VPANGDFIAATLTFDIVPGSEFCSLDSLVSFADPVFGGPGNQFETKISDSVGQPIPAVNVDLAAVRKDNTPPDLVVPADIVVNADAGLCTATLPATIV